MLAGAIPDSIRLEDAQDLAAIQVALGRHVPAERWVDDLIVATQRASLSRFGAC